MTRIDGPSLNTSGPGNGLGSEVSSQSSASGSMRGETVVPTTAQSILADAAEEITFALSEKAEEKDVEKRKVEVRSHMHLMQIEQIEELLDQAHAEGDKAKLTALARRMLDNGGAHARQQAEEAFSDPARQFLALQYALRQGEQEGASPAVLDEIADALEELMLDAGPQVRAGLNTMAAAGSVTHSSAAVEAFQGTYRDLVLGRASLGDTLNDLLEQFGGDGFESALKGMLRALGDDLSATRPSTEPARLQSLIGDLYQLEVAHTLLERCGEMSGVLEREHGKAPFAPVELLKDVVRLTGERWVGGAQVTRVAERFGCSDFPSQIRFLTELKGVIRDLPIKIFSDPEARQGLMVALQDALDAAIDREEESL